LRRKVRDSRALNQDIRTGRLSRRLRRDAPQNKTEGRHLEHGAHRHEALSLIGGRGFPKQAETTRCVTSLSLGASTTDRILWQSDGGTTSTWRGIPTESSEGHSCARVSCESEIVRVVLRARSYGRVGEDAGGDSMVAALRALSEKRERLEERGVTPFRPAGFVKLNGPSRPS